MQEELHRVRHQLDEAGQLPSSGRDTGLMPPATLGSPEQEALKLRLRELQEQFSELLLGIRRRKSSLVDGTLLDIEVRRNIKLRVLSVFAGLTLTLHASNVRCQCCIAMLYMRTWPRVLFC